MNGAESDIESSQLLISGKKYLESLFFCRLTIEKILKALVVNNTLQLAPKSHNLNYLCEIAKVNVSEEQKSFMTILMKYQLEGSYLNIILKRLQWK